MRSGADIRTLCEVKRIEPRPGGGFTVRYVEHDLARAGAATDTSKLPLVTLTADRLVVSAGTIGGKSMRMNSSGMHRRLAISS